MLFITTNKSRESSGMKMYGVLSEYGGLRMKKNGKRYVRRKIQERNNWGNNIQKIHSELVKTSSDIQDEEFLKESAERLIRILGEPTRTYKDRIFRMLLSDRKTALEVYNAMEHVMSQLIQKIRVYLSKMHIDKEEVLFHRA